MIERDVTFLTRDVSFVLVFDNYNFLKPVIIIIILQEKDKRYNQEVNFQAILLSLLIIRILSMLFLRDFHTWRAVKTAVYEKREEHTSEI